MLLMCSSVLLPLNSMVLLAAMGHQEM
jgi:hypothetical protein